LTSEYWIKKVEETEQDILSENYEAYKDHIHEIKYGYK
jgi:hypothetical protein